MVKLLKAILGKNRAKKESKWGKGIWIKAKIEESFKKINDSIDNGQIKVYADRELRNNLYYKAIEIEVIGEKEARNQYLDGKTGIGEIYLNGKVLVKNKKNEAGIGIIGGDTGTGRIVRDTLNLSRCYYLIPNSLPKFDAFSEDAVQLPKSLIRFWNKLLNTLPILYNFRGNKKKLEIVIEFIDCTTVTLKLVIELFEHEQEVFIKKQTVREKNNKVNHKKLNKIEESENEMSGDFQVPNLIPYDHKIVENSLIEKVKLSYSKQFFLHLDAKFGSGKTMQSFHAANAVNKEPVYISPWEEGYSHDVLFLIYSKITGKYKRLRFEMCMWIMLSFSIFSIDLIAIIKTFNPVFFENSTLIINAPIYFVDYLLPVLIVGFLIYNLFLYFVINNLGSTKFFHSFFVDKITNEIVKKNKILIIDDIDRMTNEDAVIEVFTILSSINKRLPITFNQCAGIVSYNTEQMKLDEQRNTSICMVPSVLECYEKKVFGATSELYGISCENYLKYLKTVINSYIKKKFDEIPKEEIIPIEFESLPQPVLKIQHLVKERNNSGYKHLRKEWDQRAVLKKNEEFFTKCKGEADLSYRDIFKYKVLIVGEIVKQEMNKEMNLQNEFPEYTIEDEESDNESEQSFNKRDNEYQTKAEEYAEMMKDWRSGKCNHTE